MKTVMRFVLGATFLLGGADAFAQEGKADEAPKAETKPDGTGRKVDDAVVEAAHETKKDDHKAAAAARRTRKQKGAKKVEEAGKLQ